MKQDIVQSIDRALNIIEVLGTGKKNLVELSNLVGLNKSTVHRLLHTLIYRGYVQQDDATTQYALTPKVLQIGQQIIEDMDIIKISKSYLEDLSKKTGEVVHLVMIENQSAIYIDKIESNKNIRMYSYIGKSIPLFSSAVGKAYLAFSDNSIWENSKEDILTGIEAFTEHTLTTAEALEKDFDGIRKRGYAIDGEENEYGIICVAAPIFNHLNKIQYAISISSPKYRLNEQALENYGQYVIETANSISNKMGGKNI